MDTINYVKEFHKIFNHPIANSPTVISSGRLNFRINFLEEELDELIEAHKNGDIIEMADALGDLQYVLDGLFIECGLADKKHNIIKEIHKSNMSKMCKTEIEAQELIKEIKKESSLAALLTYSYKQVDSYFVVYRADGKIMKSKNYSKPNLSKILSNDSK